jgi:DNA-binding CsgD family transcriptional regulator
MRDLIEVIDDIYAAGADFSLWGRAMAKVSDWVGVDDAALGVAVGDAIPWLVAPRTDPDCLKTYPHYQSSDIVWQRIVENRSGSAIADYSVIDRDDLKHNAFQNEWSAPQGYHHRLGAVLFDDAQSRAVLILPHRAAIAREQIERLDAVLGHLRRALHFSIGQSHETGFRNLHNALVETSERAMLVMDCTGRILSHSTAAEGWLTDQMAVGQLGDLARLLSAGPAALPLANRTIFPGINLRFLPLHGSAPPPVPGCPAVLFYAGSLNDRMRVQQLRQQFGLTLAEALLAMEIRRGDGRRAAAGRRGISEATARTHLSRIFEKMDISRQAELVRVIGEIT